VLNPIIETAIGLVFVYVLLSMVCSSIQEFLAALFAWRANTLRKGVENMLGKDKDLAKRIYEDPLIKSLARNSWWDTLTRRKEPQPSYIPANLFAKALLNTAGVQVSDLTAKPNIPGNLKVSDDTQKLLQTFAAYSPDFNTLLANIEAWYNDAMDRVSGWYKRKTQGYILLIAIAVAGGLNADTLMLATAFWHDPALRAATANAATEYVKTHQAPQSGTQNKMSEQDKAELFPSVTPPGSAPIPPREETLEQAGKNLTDTLTDVQAQLAKINLPLGWFCEACSDADKQKSASQNGEKTKNSASAKDEQSRDASDDSARKKAAADADKSAAQKPKPCKEDEQKKAIESMAKCVRGQIPQGSWGWLVKVFGLLLSILAISQGAPFWFDLLQKLVNLRLAGNPPPDSKKTTSPKTA